LFGRKIVPISSGGFLHHCIDPFGHFIRENQYKNKLRQQQEFIPSYHRTHQHVFQTRFKKTMSVIETYVS